MPTPHLLLCASLATLTAGMLVPDLARPGAPMDKPVCAAAALTAGEAVVSAVAARLESPENRRPVRRAQVADPAARLRAREDADRLVGRAWARGRTLSMHVAGGAPWQQQVVWESARQQASASGVRLVEGASDAPVRVRVDDASAECLAYRGIDALVAPASTPTVRLGASDSLALRIKAVAAFRLALAGEAPAAP